MKINNKLTRNVSVILLFAILAFFTFYSFRIDLTEDNRYSVSDFSKTLIGDFDSPIEVTCFLNGKLNPSFFQLRKATIDYIEELSYFAKHKISIKYFDTDNFESENQRLDVYKQLADKGLKPTEIFMRDKDGNSTRKIIFPWLEISTADKKVNVSILKNISRFSGEENISISIENLEFEITNALNQLKSKDVEKIAFLEGHGELSEAETYRIMKSLSNFYQIDRGEVNDDASVLNDYKVIIIAGPKSPFSESEKYIIDQYVMYGGKIIWFVDDIKLDVNQLASNGYTPAIESNLNLDDLFFKYGVKFHPYLLQDLQCASISVNISKQGDKPQIDLKPWHYAPFLLTSDIHPVTKHIGELKSEYASIITTVDSKSKLKSEILAASSSHSKLKLAPLIVSLDETNLSLDSTFTLSYLPVAILVEGNFESNYLNRIKPDSIVNDMPFKHNSVDTKQLFVATSSIIRNETNGLASDSTTLPLGYDKIMDVIFGNEQFVLNAIHFLAGHEDLMSLRNKIYRTRMLNKQIDKQKRATLQIINVALPILLMLCFIFPINYISKKRHLR
ncbi:gliding motility-associated ABC transporter substrate-binding protein GldG [Paludibacter sp.]